MKKRVVRALAAGMAGIFLFPASAMAANTTSPQSVTVTYTQGNEYIISIPPRVNLSLDKDISYSITADKINIAPDKKVQVSVASGISDGKVTLTRINSSGNDTITSTVSLSDGGKGIADNETIAVFKEMDSTPETGGTLYFTALNKALAKGEELKAGDWSGTLTFSIAVVDK